MILRGIVQRGVVVLDKEVHLAEGQVVTVIAPDQANGTGATKPHRLLDIAPVSLGGVCAVVDEDLLGEMLEGRS